MRALGSMVKQTDELKKLIKEYPDYPIVVLVGNEICAGDDYYYWYAPCVSFGIREILDCEQDVDDTFIFSDRDEFEEKIRWNLEDDYEDDDEFEKAVKDMAAKYEPYWKKVIAITCDV